MSVQFGKWNFNGSRVDERDLRGVAPLLKHYGPDRQSAYSDCHVALQFHTCFSTGEVAEGEQPYRAHSGNVLMWNGRLDNRDELVPDQAAQGECPLPDVAIVAALYEKCGPECFSKLIGDWSVSIWEPTQQVLVLAKDVAGIQPLFYATSIEGVIWSSLLKPLVAFHPHPLAIEEEYVAGWFSLFPEASLTPYRGIRAVPPSTYLRIESGRVRATSYWEFLDRPTRYRDDSQYEQHFRELFAQSVRRRLRSDRPVLAELSGGMDSSSIVCMADSIAQERPGTFPRVDTLSYYNNHDPNWNEKPYFTQVEEARGRKGCHIDTGVPGSFSVAYEDSEFVVTPGTDLKRTEAQKLFRRYVEANGHRVVLSGIGGDEVLGGVPTGLPELADLLVKFRGVRFTRRLVDWAVATRRPAFHLLSETFRSFLPEVLRGTARAHQAPSWLDADFAARNREALSGYPKRLHVFGALPTFQENLHTLDALRRQLASAELPCEPCFEWRYPFLDRDLLQFLYTIPREQLIRPGERRSLMRRALKGIVPDGILARKRKAFLTRVPLGDLARAWTEENLKGMRTVELGIVDIKKFSAVLDFARQGGEVPVVAILRTLLIEGWLVKQYGARIG